MSTSKALITVDGKLSVEFEDGRTTDLGAVAASVTGDAQFQFCISVAGPKGEELFSQALETSCALSFPKPNAVEWLYTRENGERLLLTLTLSERANEFRAAVARGIIETAYRADLESKVGEDDRSWVTEGAVAVPMTDAAPPAFGYSNRKTVRASLTSAAAAAAAQLDDYDDDEERSAQRQEEDEADEDRSLGLKQTPIKSRASGIRSSLAGGNDDDDEDGGANGFTRSARKSKISSVVAGMNRGVAFAAYGSQLGMFKHTSDGDLKYLNRIPEVKGKDGATLTPAQMQLHNADQKLLMLDDDNRDRIYNLDIETGTVIDEWQGREGVKFNSLAPRTKYAQVSNENLVVGVSDNAVFSIDPRVSGKNKTAEECSYATKVQLSNAATTESGYLAVASKTGEIRLFNKLQKNYCKTVLPGLGNAVKSISVTADGQWILATCETYLILMNVAMDGAKNGEARTGFDSRMGVAKPKPIKLSLLPTDMLRLKIDKVSFSPAMFNTGTLANSKEEWIATSTGNHVVTWDFAQVKKGNYNAYKVRQSDAAVVMDVFRHNYADELLVAEQNSLYMSHLNRTYN